MSRLNSSNVPPNVPGWSPSNELEAGRPIHAAGVDIPLPCAHATGVESEVEPLLAFAQRLFGATSRPLDPHPLKAEAELTSNIERQAYFIRAENVGRGAVHHEFAHEPAVRHDRNKRQRADTFSLHRRPKCGR